MWVEPIYCHLRSTRSHQHLRVYVAFSVWWPNMFNKAGVSIDHCSNPSLELWGWFYCTQLAENVYHRGTPQLPLILFEQGWLKASSVDWSNPGKMVPAVIWAEVSYISFILLTIFFTIVIGMVLVFCSGWKSDRFPHETLPGHAMDGTCPARRAGSGIVGCSSGVSTTSAEQCWGSGAFVFSSFSPYCGHPALEHQMVVGMNRYG